MSTHILSLLIFFPLLVAVLFIFIPRQAHGMLRNVSVGAMVVEFLLSLRVLIDGDYSKAGYQLVEQYAWIESLGISYKVGIDGISLWLVILTTFITPVALYASWTGINTKVKEFAIAFLALESAMLGAFLSLDLFVFYVFWELMLVPMYLIVGIWGGPQRVYAAVKFFLYTLVGSLLMLIAILYVVAQYKALAGAYSFDLEELKRVVLSSEEQALLFGAFFLAFAIKVPMFPFHTWLPDAHVQAPTGGSVILAAVLLKMGTYGFIRFAIPLFPYASYRFGPTIAVFAIIGIIYGAVCAWMQKDVKKLVAYSSVSHLGFVMLGIFSATPYGVEGAILQMINHGISTGALFLLVGVIYERRHTRDLDQFGGLAKSMPVYALLFVIVTMSSIGLPGTNGFVGEFMILAGTFTSSRLAMPMGATLFAFFAATGVILAAIYMLHAVLKMFWGPITKPENAHLPDVGRRELVTLVPLVVLIFALGLFPNVLLEPMRPAVSGFVREYMQRSKLVDRERNTSRLLPKADAPAVGAPAEGAPADGAPTDAPPGGEDAAPAPDDGAGAPEAHLLPSALGVGGPR